MPARQPYQGAFRKLVLAFDVGTTYSAVSYSILNPGELPVVCGVNNFPGIEQIEGNSKIPTVVYYDNDGNARAFGGEALQDSIIEQAEDEQWMKLEWWTLHIQSKNPSQCNIRKDDILPLPPFCCGEMLSNLVNAESGQDIMQNNDGTRVLEVIIVHKLRPITELCGDDFFDTWWATVQCHRALWKNGVYHRDISPSNLMYYRHEKQKVVGVLIDLDLASTSNNPTTSKRTGTVPFMALDLLTEKAHQDDVQHLYQHDAESFIWVLVWISLRYSGGKRVGKDENGKRPLDDWVTNRDTCRKEKYYFLLDGWLHMKVSGDDHALNFRIANLCLNFLHARFLERATKMVEGVPEEDEVPKSDQALRDEKAYQELLCNPITKLKPDLASWC